MIRIFARLGFILAATVVILPCFWTMSSAQEVDLKSLQHDVQKLASAEFEGRGIGTQGLERALEYLEGRFEQEGLQPLGDQGYRQSFYGPGGEKLTNLVGLLGDRSADRHVILAAHYDHLGLGQSGEANHGALHAGADDNASGVAILLESARRLREEGELARPVLFIAFAGEEIGLLGSAHYVDQPVLPLNQCTAMINLDTVGRLFDGSLTILGSSTAEELPAILRGVNYAYGFQMEMPEKDPGGSDQVSFTRRGVPAIQLFTGPHPDYHRPGDTPDKIDYVGLERLAGYTTELLLYFTDREKELTFVPPGAEKAAEQASGSPRQGRRVSFGSIPDFNHSGEGVLLSGVIPGSPADKAGLKAGDVVLEFAEIAIADLKSFSDVLRGLSPGDEVTVTYERDGERLITTVTVVERR